MTRTAMRAISLEGHKKKVPYKGFTRRSDTAWKTRTALLETRTVPQKRCELMKEAILLLQNFVFFKMSNEVNILKANFTCGS